MTISRTIIISELNLEDIKMGVNATMLIKTLDGQYKTISYEDIEQVHINYLGEKMVFFKDGYGIEVETKEGE